MRKTSRVLARLYDLALQPVALNVTQLAVLRAIARNPDTPLVRVAEELAMDRTSFYRAVATMQRRGWLRQGPGHDARARNAALTKAGEAALREAAPAWDEIQQDVVERFGRRRWQQLVADLQELQRLAGELGGDGT